MAACNLKIELDDPKRPRLGGEPVSGTVVVTSTERVKCNGLEIASCWSTHGRGNIDKGDVEECVVYEGNWEPHREYRYPFKLKTAVWPPTYYGTYMNVSHSVRARARLPWKSDPKTEVEFPLIATNAPEDLKPTVTTKKSNSLIAWTVGVLVLIVLVAIFSVLLLVILPIVGIIAALFWFFRVFLPQQATGTVESSLEPQRVAGGETVRGAVRFRPRRDLTINGVHWTVKCVEKCVSGTGSDRKTHTHEIFSKTELLAPAGVLRAGEPQNFEFLFAVPENAPPSLKFTANELIWSGEFRVDIAKWPDWVKTWNLMVVPSAKAIAGTQPGGEWQPRIEGPLRVPSTEEEAWFLEVLGQVARYRDDATALQTILDAVREQVFTFRISILEPLEGVPATPRQERGIWMLADHPDSDVELCLLWPQPLRAPFEESDWSGQATILGYDHDLECLLMRVVPPPLGAVSS